MMKALLLTILPNILVARFIKEGVIGKHQLELEKEIIGNWANNYVDALFKPSTQHPHKFNLGELVLIRAVQYFC